MIKRYIISATRNDGLECSGAVECDETEIRRINGNSWRPFKARGAVVCAIDGHNPNRCTQHVGEVFTFHNRAYREDT